MRVLLFTGKGGVGKTTTAAATAVHAARGGVKTLLLSTDAAHSLADTLACPLTVVPREVEPGLFAAQVDGRALAQRSWAGVQGYIVQVLEALGVDSSAAAEMVDLPGAEDVLGLLEVRDQVQQGPWDLLVVDCAPTAETLRLLALPEALSRGLDRLLPMDLRLARAMRPRLARSGAALPVPHDHVVAAARRLTQELAGVREVLLAPSTSVRLVLTPESVVVAEARRTLTTLSLYGYRVDEVVANRVFPAAAGGWTASWAAAQAKLLDDVRASFAPARVRQVGYREHEPVGLEALSSLGRELFGAEGLDAALRPATLAPPLSVERSGQEFVLQLQLPLAERQDVRATRQGDDLVVAVGGHRRVLALPSALRRCIVVGASMRHGRLRIRFEPDPALWRSM